MAKQYGLIAKFDSPADIMHAAEKVRDAGYKNWDVITPFPIHGMDAAMGLKRSLVGRFTIVGGTIGITTGMLMIWFTGGSELSLPFMEGYKLIVGGKPFFSPQFAFPVSYELTILFSAFASIGGMFILNRLPRHHHPFLKYKDVAKGTDDSFFLYIENVDPQFDEEKTRSFLDGLSSGEVRELED
ncbi:MAG TPA: DUF3341 domain-containing protein [Opitutae bacterium]|mgnify:FL=1|nr:hypothetical protein [Opitutaceae bacterium]HCR31676.1 DUF3341 domain-containing protein [Opitutae bacterium]